MAFGSRMLPSSAARARLALWPSEGFVEVPGAVRGSQDHHLRLAGAGCVGGGGGFRMWGCGGGGGFGMWGWGEVIPGTRKDGLAKIMAGEIPIL